MKMVDSFVDMPMELQLAGGPASACVMYAMALHERPGVKPDGVEMARVFYDNFSGSDAWKSALRDYIGVLEVTGDKEQAMQAYCGMVGMYAAMIAKEHPNGEQASDN